MPNDNFDAVKLLTAEDWPLIHPYAIDISEAADIAQVDVDVVKSRIKLKSGSKQIYRIANDAFLSIIIIEDEVSNEFTAMTRYH